MAAKEAPAEPVAAEPVVEVQHQAGGYVLTADGWQLAGQDNE